MGKEKAKCTGEEPWYSAYNRFNLFQRITRGIPKRLRSIRSAKKRLRAAKSIKAADYERLLIERRLAEIEGAYSSVRRALRDGYVCFGTTSLSVVAS